ncbi:MAG: hypothetical protein QW279_12905 [Candidatus Jordarchaeaceae archaeon]
MIEDIKRIFEEGNKHPVYCLQKNEIEDYLFEDLPPHGYTKRLDGPKIAEKLDRVPEIEEILSPFKT